MQNKGAIQVFAILLALACIWHLSFTFVTNRVESKVRAEAGDSTQLEQAMLDSLKSKVVYNLGFVKYTYDDCKKREINLGLDLKGGMNVTLEVSVPDLLKAMSNESQDSAFNKALKSATELQKTSQKNYVDLFAQEFERFKPGGRLGSPSIFGHGDQAMIKSSMRNEEVIAILKREADQAILRTYEVLNARIDQFGVTQPNIQLLQGTNRILVELPGVKDPTRVQELLQAQAKLEFYETFENTEVYPALEKIDAYLAKIKIIDRNDTTLGSVDTSGTDSLQLTLNPTDTSKTDTSKVDTNKLDTSKGGPGGNMGGGMTDAEQEKLHPLFYRMTFNFYKGENDQQFLAPGPMIGISASKDTALVNKYFRMPDVAKFLPKDIKLRWTKKSLNEEGAVFGLIALKTAKGKPALDGDVIADAYDEPDDNKGGFRVTMKMNDEGATQWAIITKRNAPTGNTRGRCIAIVLDDKVYSYPTVEGQIKGGISSISGSFTADEAKTLASVLKAGKYPTPANIVEQAVVGPSLGKKAINAGVFSLIAAFIVILLYMVFYYGKAGIVADLSLMANVFFLFGSLAALGTTLTLPGIAGIVLTLGMAVDANVLIYERIKEELRHGKRLKIALEDGYKMALSSIIDSNLTTIIIAIILMVFGAGPVKGFAVVLFVGILTSMFSAIFLSRLIFEFMLKKNWSISFFTKPTENIMRNPKFNFVGRRKIYYVISGVLITAGIISFAAKGFNLGIDLKGGRSYTVVLDNTDANISEVSDALKNKFGSAPVVKFYGSNDRLKLITKYKVEQTDSATEREIEKMIYEALTPMYKTQPNFADFSNKDNDIGLVESYIVGPTVAKDVAVKSIWAVILSLVMIFLYVFFRFKGWYFGLGALIALMHDVIIVLAVFSIFDGILPINLEIDQAIIAAVLTVIGYSINDTVIIFDRIREYLGDGKGADRKGLINSALNSTLGRTINTSLTVFLVLIISFIFGGEAVRGFAFAILIGVVVGTYSSICIATPIVIDLKKDKLPLPGTKK
jgi:SecD/SecF fusion protein